MAAKLNESAVEALPAPEKGSRIHYFPEAIVHGVQVPRGFGVRITAAGVRSFVLRRRVRGPGHADRTVTIGRWPDWKVPAAVREAREVRKGLEKGDDPIAKKRAEKAAAGDTLKAVAESYLAREGGKLRSAEWRRKQLERLVFPTLGARAICDIRRIEIIELLDHIEDTRGPAMAHQTLAILRRIFNWYAIRNEEFRPPLVRGMGRINSREQARQRILSDGEIRTLWKFSDEAKGTDAVFGRVMKFLLLTGARRGEATGMTWAELDGTDWILPPARNKTKLELVRPLSKTARAVLPGRTEGSDFVFTADGRPLSGFSNFKSKVKAATGLTGWTPHDLRRTARSLLSRAGVSSDHAERCLGHVLVGVRGVYDRHEYYDEKRKAYEALAALIKRILNPQPNVTSLRDRRARA
jgi:integrase